MMFTFRILLCAWMVFVPSLASNVDLNDVDIKVFEFGDRSTEDEIQKSLERTDNLFNSDYFSVAMDVLAAAEIAVVAVGGIELTPFILIIQSFGDLLANSDAWKSDLSKSVSDEIARANIETILFQIESKLRSMKEQIEFLMEKTDDKYNDCHTTALIIQYDLNVMAGYFVGPNSPFQKYPLVAAPTIINLALAIAIFQPISIKLELPQHLQLPCKAHGLLVEYRARVLEVRLDYVKASHFSAQGSDTEINFTDELNEVLMLSKDAARRSTDIYTNVNTTGVLRCNKGKCSDVLNYCLNDLFDGTSFVLQQNELDNDNQCMQDYVAVLRYNVEKMFPVELLKKLCGVVKVKKPTGRGWLQFTVKNVYARYVPSTRDFCDSTSNMRCDIYVKVFVNETEILKTDFENNKNFVRVNRGFQSKDVSKGPISKSTKIKIQIWDDNFSSDDLLQETDGDIDSYLNEPLRKGFRSNKIETSSIWIDELENAQ